MKHFFPGFIGAFVGSMVAFFFLGKQADTLNDILTVYFVKPLMVGLIVGLVTFWWKGRKEKPSEE